ncbi:MAG: hypothetical protein PVJ67_01260 [Candidatus Pacearchaeota archaeon]|jgi:hypothetical protein
MAKQTIYGDENLSYTVKAKDMSPIIDGIYMHLPSERICALDKRMKDGELKLRE